MRAVLLMSDVRKNGVYRRVIMSGGGTVVKCHSLHQLCHKPPTPGDITHIFIDPWILNTQDSRHALFTRFRNICDQHQLPSCAGIVWQ